MENERKLNQPENVPEAPEPLHFDELPFHIRCFVFLHEHYTELSLPNRIVLWLALAGIILAPLAVAGKPLLRDWKQANLFRAARQYAEAGDVRSATKAYSSSLGRSKDPAKWREFAIFSDANSIGNTSEIWKRVTELDPTATDGWVGLIEASLKAGDIATAVEAVERVPPGLENDINIQLVRGSAMALAGRQAEARAALDLTRKADLKDPKSRLSVALLAFDVGDPTQKAEARESLHELAKETNPQIRLTALAALLKNCVAENLRVAGISAARQIIDDPDASLSTRIDSLTALIKWNAPDFSSSVLTVGKFASGTANQQLALMQFLLGRNQGAAARTWLDSMGNDDVPAEQRHRLEAEIDLADGDWNAFLTNIVKSGVFGANSNLADRLVRIAVNRAADSQAALDEWSAALREIPELAPSLDIAMNIAERTDWQPAVAATMEYALLLRPNDPLLLRRLAAHYRRTLDLVALQRIQERLATVEPANLSAKNAALLGRLILGVGNPTIQLSEASRLLEADPSSASFQTTYAMALYRAGRLQEAADVFAKMKPAEAENPERALYRGLILAELGERSAALRELNRADRHRAEMFPELITLLNRARNRVDSGSTNTSLPPTANH